jgi:hypothetical protein
MQMSEENFLCSFRYRSICNHSLSDISESQLYFSLPSQLNDSFDLQLDLAKIQREIIEEHRDIKAVIKEDVIKEFRAKASVSGVICFSDNPLNERMWEEYASGSSGICCTYQIPPDFIKCPENKLLGWSPVDYGGESAFKEALYELLKNPNPKDFLDKVVTKYLTVKSAPWDYEKEFRIIRSQSGTLKIPKPFLRQIIFGTKTKRSKIRLIRDIVKSNGYGNIIFAQVIDNSIIELSI